MGQVVITFDTDWAPDFAIDATAEIVRSCGIKSTWFVTHRSPAIDRLAEDPERIELGIHPNLLPGSSHGANEDDVLRHALELVPGAVSLRTHALVQSSPLMIKLLRETDILNDVSIFLPRACSISPAEFRIGDRSLFRIPYIWEDDYEMLQSEPAWTLDSAPLEGPGIRILNFHPIHVYLNSADLSAYQRLRSAQDYSLSLRERDAGFFVHTGIGTRTLLESLVEHLSTEPTACIRELSSIRA